MFCQRPVSLTDMKCKTLYLQTKLGKKVSLLMPLPNVRHKEATRNILNFEYEHYNYNWE